MNLKQNTPTVSTYSMESVIQTAGVTWDPADPYVLTPKLLKIHLTVLGSKQEM